MEIIGLICFDLLALIRIGVIFITALVVIAFVVYWAIDRYDKNSKENKRKEIYNRLSLPNDPPPDYSMIAPFDFEESAYAPEQEATAQSTVLEETEAEEDWVDELNFYDMMDDD